MMEGQFRDDFHMLRSNWQNRNVILGDFPIHKFIQWLNELVFSKTDFYGNFPITGGTEPEIVFWVQYQLFRGQAELRIIKCHPEQSMSIEQKCQFMYSWNCPKCSSSS